MNPLSLFSIIALMNSGGDINAAIDKLIKF